MITSITITPKWQIHIPAAVREALNLTEPGKAILEVEKDQIVIKPKKSKVLKMAGKYKKKRPIKKLNLDKVRDYIDYTKI